jgi:hypothetical protein
MPTLIAFWLVFVFGTFLSIVILAFLQSCILWWWTARGGHG